MDLYTFMMLNLQLHMCVVIIQSVQIRTMFTSLKTGFDYREKKRQRLQMRFTITYYCA